MLFFGLSDPKLLKRHSYKIVFYLFLFLDKEAGNQIVTSFPPVSAVLVVVVVVVEAVVAGGLVDPTLLPEEVMAMSEQA